MDKYSTHELANVMLTGFEKQIASNKEQLGRTVQNFMKYKQPPVRTQWTPSGNIPSQYNRWNPMRNVSPIIKTVSS